MIVSIFLINCNGQGKENSDNKANLTNSTFLGVTKTNSLYTVYNRCDGGYSVLRFEKNEFYFYTPQEGSYYIIRDIKYNNNKYIINTKGYYFLKGENILNRNDTWYLEKQDDLVWSFRNQKWKNSIILSDSLNINKNKITYKIQPCRECSEDCQEQTIDNNLIGFWSTNCESPVGLTIKENEIVVSVEPNQYYIHLSKIQAGTEKNITMYKLKQFEGLGSKDVSSEVYFNDKEIAIIKTLDNNKIELNWLGFYNKMNKQRQYTEPLISNENPIILNKCGK